MGRKRCRRRIGFLPQVEYFKPAGIKLTDLEEVVIHHDELEALRLKDLMGEQQEEAAKRMGVSQPTFHRLLQSAHQKVADALVNGKAIRIEGGNVMVEPGHLPFCGGRGMCWGMGSKHRLLYKGFLEAGGPMKIAVTSVDGSVDGPVDERFGRARRFIVYDIEARSYTIIDNTASTDSVKGAGIQSAQHIINAGAKILITGHLGPNAFRVLDAAGIEVYTVSGMTVKEAIEAYLAKNLKKLSGPDVSGQW